LDGEVDTAKTELLKLELGSGQRPTPGYLHNDVNDFPGIDIVGNPWELEVADGTLGEVLALGVIEHLTYRQVQLTLAKIHSALAAGGEFWFDVPDIVTWCRYVVDYFDGKAIPFAIQHVFATLYGWQRWPGDEHKSGWYLDLLQEEVARAGFVDVSFGVDQFLARGHSRGRMHRPADAHIYLVARKPVER
jgi:predicted SAM-dependent methyltransferase